MTEDIADLAALKLGFRLIQKFCHSHNECSDACVLYPVCEDLVFKNIGCQCEYALDLIDSRANWLIKKEVTE